MFDHSNQFTASNAYSFLIGGELRVNRLGYGAMRLTGQPGNFGPYPDWGAGQKLLRRAVELGVNFIDTAEAYGPGFNEDLIASALHPYSPDTIIATKGGINKPAPDNIQADGRSENLRRGCEASLQRLKVEQIDLYQLHRPDPKVPLAESVKICDASDEVTNFDVYGENIYLLTHKNAPRFKIVKTSLKNPDFSQAEPVLEQSDMLVKDMVAAKDALYVRTTDGGIGRLIRIPYSDQSEQLKLPIDGAVDLLTNDPRVAGILLSLMTWTRASSIYEYNPNTNQITETGLQPKANMTHLKI